MSRKETRVVCFECTGDIPPDYTGWCFVEEHDERYYFKDGLVDTDIEVPDEASCIHKYGRWWCREGKYHRIGGPAFIRHGEVTGPYYLNGIEYSEQEYWSQALKS